MQALVRGIKNFGDSVVEMYLFALTISINPVRRNKKPNRY
jgi:hypothetical protein